MDSKPICHTSRANKMKCFFLDCVHFWWSARLVNELKPHLPPLSSQTNEMLIFWLCSTSDDQPGWLMDSNPICHPPQPIKWNAFYWIKFTSDDQPGWLMDSNPICHLSPAKKMKCSFLYYVQLLMISWAGRWTQTPSTTPVQPKQWNAHFSITFNIWCWPDWSMDLNLIHHPSPANKMKCSFLGYVQLLMISQAVRWTQTPSATPLQPIKWNAPFWITFNFWWSAGLVDRLEPHPPPDSSQKLKCSYFDYVQLLMIGRAGQWTRTPSTTPLHPKRSNPHFCITFNFWCWPDWSMDSNPIHHPSPAKKWNAHILIMFNFWWSARLVNGLKPHPPPLCTQKNEMLIFGLRSTSDDQPGWSMDLNPIHHLSPAKKWNAHILILLNFWWLARLVNGLKPHPPPLSSQ